MGHGLPNIARTTMAQPAMDNDELIRTVNDLYLTRLFSCVATTLVMYDWILVFSAELETIYKSRWTVAKFLFCYIRIITPPGIVFSTFLLSDLRPALSAIVCKFWLIFSVLLGLPTSIIAANCLLALRLIALYRHQRYIIWSIYSLFFISYAVTFSLLIEGVVSFMGTIFYSEPFHICSSLGSTKIYSGIFYAPAVFETWVFGLTAYRAWRDAKIIASPGSAPFLTVLYRDGLISFLVMMAIRVWNMWIYTTAPLSSYNMGTVLMWALNTVLTTRVYMNLVWLAKRPTLDNTFSLRNTTIGPSIRMRVYASTEVEPDKWLNTLPSPKETEGDKGVSLHI